VQKSVEGILKVVGQLMKEDSAKFFRLDGEIIPW
jgi:hypothetical protein